MPTQRASFKHLRQTKKRTVKNRAEKDKVKDLTKKVRRAVDAKQTADMETMLRAAIQAIDKAAKHGVMKKNTAARKKSRLVTKLNAAKKSA